MLYDDNFTNSTHEDVQRFLVKLYRLKYPRSTIQKMRIKYDEFVDDPEKRLLQRLGIGYEDHDIRRPYAGMGLYIDGYTEKQWKLLFDPNWMSTPTAIKSAIATLRKREDNAAVSRLEEKYADILTACEKKLLEKHLLPIDTDYKKISKDAIDGMSFSEWKAHNDNNYIPTKTYLVSLLRKYEQNGDEIKAAAIANKYDYILNEGAPVPDISIDEAHDILDQLLGQPNGR